MVYLSDLSSAIQLAAGVNAAVGAILAGRQAYLAPHREYVDYIRSELLPRIVQGKDKERLEQSIAYADSRLLRARFSNPAHPRRLAALCLTGAAACTALLIAPAFSKDIAVDTWVAAFATLASFLPFPLALLGMKLENSRHTLDLKLAKNEIAKAAKLALNGSDAVPS